MPNALITGLTGQDGSYLAELLIHKGYNVFGVVRELDRDAVAPLPGPSKAISLYQWDMRNQQAINQMLQHSQVEVIYNFAAHASGSGMYDDPIGIGDVNGIAVVRLLEAIREIDKSIKLCQASSSEMFGKPIESPQTEKSTFRPRSPYGVAKLYAHAMIEIYRERYGIFACSAILYNHESPRRRLEFVTRKIVHEAVRIKLGIANELLVGNLDSFRDWGFAGDYVEAMWRMMRHSVADDYVVASGELHSVREFCEHSFSYLGLDYRDYVRVDQRFYRQAEAVPLVGDASKAMKVLNWEPKTSFRDLVRMMIDSELRSYETHNS